MVRQFFSETRYFHIVSKWSVATEISARKAGSEDGPRMVSVDQLADERREHTVDNRHRRDQRGRPRLLRTPTQHEAGDDPRSTAANGRAGLLAGRRRAGTCPPRTTRRRPCGSTRRPCAVCTALVRHARAARRRRHTGANTTSRSRCGGYRSGSAPAPAYRGRDHRRRPESGWRKAPPQHNAATRIRNRDRSIWYHAHRLIDLGQIWRRSLGAMWPD